MLLSVSYLKLFNVKKKSNYICDEITGWQGNQDGFEHIKKKTKREKKIIKI